MEYFNQPDAAGANQLRVTKLLFVESGTYNDMALRPFVTDVSNQTLHQLEEATRGGTDFSSSVLSGIAGSLIRPMASPIGAVSIANGWDTRRFRFLMEVEYSSIGSGRVVQYLAGFTDQAEYSYSGLIDPRMRLRFNTAIVTRRTLENTPVGQQYTTNLTNASHLLFGGYNPDITSTVGAHTMRPEDVFGAMGASVLGGNYIDGRSMFATGMKKSRRDNSSAPAYLSRIMSTYNTSMQRAGYQDDLPAMMTDARGHVMEDLISKDRYLSTLTRETSLSEGDSVSYGELCALSPDLDRITQIMPIRAVHQELGYRTHERGQSENWTGTTQETVMATILSHSVPSLMMSLMLTELTFAFTNQTIDGRFTIQYTGPAQSFCQPPDPVSGFQPDLSPQLTAFAQLLETEVLRDLTQNNQIDINASMHVNIIGETWIHLSIAGGPMIEYNTPSFADALMAPVMTNDHQNLQVMAMDLQQLADQLCTSNAVKTPDAFAFSTPHTTSGHSNGTFDTL